MVELGTVAAAGAGGAGGTAAGLCRVPIEQESFDPNETYVYVDCQPIPHIEPPWEGEPAESWHFLTDLTAVVLSEPLCSRLEDNGFERFEILYGCKTIDP